MENKVEILFGRKQLAVSLPKGARATVIRKVPLPKLPNQDQAVRQALDHPISAKPFGELAKGRKSACILICDITRPVPNNLFLRPMVEDLLKGGMSAENICVVVATGLHRPNEGVELEELVGDPWVLKTVRVENHFARNDADHVDMGRTSRGTPVKIDRRFVDADLRVVTGLVEPHFMAGWSGGRKVIAPGVAHQETIRTFHSALFMEHPLATQCNLNSNPLHEEQLAIVKMIGEVYAVNTVIDEDRDLVHVNFGEVTASHLEAVDFITSGNRCSCGTSLPHGADFFGRVPAGQNVLSNCQGNGNAHGHSGTGRNADHCFGMFGRFRLAGVSPLAGETGGDRSSPLPGNVAGEDLCRNRRMADGDAVEANASRPHQTLHHGAEW